MLIDMIHDNHGEPALKTRYRDPAVLRAYGYEAIVIPDALSAIPAAHSDSPPALVAPSGNAPTTRKPEDVEAAIDAQVNAAVAAGMKVFFYADALLLPKSIVNRHPADFFCEDGSARLCPAKPAVLAALQDQIHELFDRWPAAAGLIMRTGEVYPESTPHMVGSTLHAANCAACRDLSRLDRLVNFIQAMHDAVITDRNKIYVHRAWQPSIPGLPNMHDNPDTYREISARLPASPNLAFSFKFTRGDFLRGQPFNPCLLADDRPKWIEFQCEREFEGKGALPNFQAPIWHAFFAHLMRAEGNLSLDELHARFNLWGWSRGGGWGGPYVQREEWIDANVFALAQLARNPVADVADIATQWAAQTFNIAQSSPPAPAITELLMISAPTIRKLLYISAIRAPSDAPWIKDDLLDVEAIWSAATRAVDLGKAAEACQEKIDALAGVDRIRYLFDLAAPDLQHNGQARALANTLIYYGSLAGTIAMLFNGFVHYIQWDRSELRDAVASLQATEHLEHAQAYWQDHSQRHALLPGAPTVFHENTLWARTNDCLEQMRTTVY